MSRLLTNGMRIGKATVIVDIVPKGNPEIRPGKKMVPQFITEHNTGNAGKGADAEAHNKYIHNMARLQPKDTNHVSWHLTVDENYIYQHIPFDETAWHCGDGANGPGNSKSIGIEIAMHADQKNYMQAEENAIALTVYLMKTFNIPVKNVKPHQDWSGKFCPQVILRRDGTFAKFRARVDAAYQMNNVAIVESAATTHKVAKGESLSLIAKRYVTTVNELVKLNKLANANMIYVGQMLIIKNAPTANEGGKPKVLLNETGRKECKEMIQRGVEEKLFTSDHKNMDKYSDVELISYSMAYVNRKTKPKK